MKYNGKDHNAVFLEELVPNSRANRWWAWGVEGRLQGTFSGGICAGVWWWDAWVGGECQAIHDYTRSRLAYHTRPLSQQGKGTQPLCIV